MKRMWVKILIWDGNQQGSKWVNTHESSMKQMIIIMLFVTATSNQTMQMSDVFKKG